MDVDGVLCPFGALRDHTWNFHKGYHVYTSSANTERLRALLVDFDIHWCTAWDQGANWVIGPLHGLPVLPVVDLKLDPLTGMQDHPIHWKQDAIESYVGDQPYAFVDDDIHDLSVQWAQERSKTVPTLYLPVDHKIGLTDDHVKRLTHWALTSLVVN